MNFRAVILDSEGRYTGCCSSDALQMMEGAYGELAALHREMETTDPEEKSRMSGLMQDLEKCLALSRRKSSCNFPDRLHEIAGADGLPEKFRSLCRELADSIIKFMKGDETYRAVRDDAQGKIVGSMCSPSGRKDSDGYAYFTWMNREFGMPIAGKAGLYSFYEWGADSLHRMKWLSLDGKWRTVETFGNLEQALSGVKRAIAFDLSGDGKTAGRSVRREAGIALRVAGLWPEASSLMDVMKNPNYQS